MPCTCTYPYRTQHVIAEGKGDAVVDVDGSYLYMNYKQMVDVGSSVSPLGPPQQPPQGWVALPLTKTGVESSTLILFINHTLYLAFYICKSNCKFYYYVDVCSNSVTKCICTGCSSQ